MSKTINLKIRPYARLLTMLGEQLIKNERIALIELIKNSYDADADWVKVSFQNFGDNYGITESSKIIIEDNGCGMDADLIKKHWMNPATPEKRKRKKVKTAKGRIIQGEKGIGRFAIFKLGQDIEIITRRINSNIENSVNYKFSKYDEEFLSENGKEKELFIDDLNIELISRTPITIVPSDILLGTKKKKREPNGTRIEITALKGSWTEKKVEAVYRDLSRLQSIFTDVTDKSEKAENFRVYIFKNENLQRYQEQYLEDFKYLLDERSVIQVTNGLFNNDNNTLSFEMQEANDKQPKKMELSLRDSNISGLKMFKDYFTYKDENNTSKNILDKREIECGSFKFSFYIFDFDKTEKVPSKYKLKDDEKRLLREHRIYLYRDNIRVFPYGEPDDDWLRIDAYRGTISAGAFLSNDQVVGYVKITQAGNPKLKDKTNREGLIEEGNATGDFIILVQTLLAYIRQKPYARYRNNIKNRKNRQDIFLNNQVERTLNDLKNNIKNNSKAFSILTKIEKEYKLEKQYLTQRAETTEELAGVGLSVETASHDIMGIMSKVLSNIDGLISDLMSNSEIDKDELLKELQSIRGGMSFIEAQLKDIQLLFRSSKQRRKLIKIETIIGKVERIYHRLLKKESINLVINTTISPLVAKTTDAVLLQLFLNLIDNSVYWLQQSEREDKKIEIFLDGEKGQMFFSDNGPGIEKEDAPYIFEPFYSGKGEEGRGLGLYIARQLLERNDYSIELGKTKSEKILSGANFVVNFIGDNE